MHLLVLILSLLTIQSSFAQVNICTADPLPAKILSLEQEKYLRASFDSVQKAARSGSVRSFKEVGDTASNTKTAFKELQTVLLQSAKDKGIDSAATYEQIFEETHSYHTDASGNTSSTYGLIKKDTIVIGRQFYNHVKTQASRLQRVQSFSYGGLYLIIRVCNQYIGESSWGSAKTYYFKKQI